MCPECILLYSRELHFLVPPTHPPTRFYREYVFRYRILVYSQSVFRIRISRVFWAYSGVFSHNSRIRTEYGRSFLPKIYTFEIRQNTAYFEKYGKIRQNTDRIRVIRNCTKSDKKLYPSPFGRGRTLPSYLSQECRWMDEMIDTHLYPHGPYAMGALDNLSNVIVYYINVSTK